MIALLQRIVSSFVCWIETGVMTVFNLVIVGVAAALQGIFDALPSFPSVTAPTEIQQGYNWISTWFPLSWFFTNLVAFILFAIAWWLISIPLRWGKAMPGSE
jgi:archaellum biogenesis protein FlaJ (TadC family)